MLLDHDDGTNPDRLEMTADDGIIDYYVSHDGEAIVHAAGEDEERTQEAVTIQAPGIGVRGAQIIIY